MKLIPNRFTAFDIFATCDANYYFHGELNILNIKINLTPTLLKY